MLLMGCGHPGIIKICKYVQSLLRQNIYALLGGFHFEFYPDFAIRKILNQIWRMGIKEIGPNHSSAAKFDIIQKEFKGAFIPFGLGNCVELNY